MKFRLIVILTTLVSTHSVAQNQWVQKDSVNGAPRSVSASFVVNGEGYIVGGLDSDGFRRSMFSYTFWQDDWDDEPSIGGLSGDGNDRGSACGFSLNNKGYLCLGQGDSNPFFGDLLEFNEDTDAWTQKANFIGSERRQAVAFTIGDYAYVGTGIDQTGLKKDMYRYDATLNVWTQIADFGGTPRKEAVGFSMGGQGYIGTGDDGIMRDDFWQYEPTTDSWSQKTDFPGGPRKGAVSWGQFPTGFICLGEDINFNYTNDLWEYNYFSDTWIQRADFPGSGRTSAIVFVQNDLAFVGTGYDGEFYDDMYAYRRIVGTESLNQNTKTKIFPNPAAQSLTILTDLFDAKVKIISMDGKDITDQVNMVKTYGGHVIDRMNLPNGSYFLQLVNASSAPIHSELINFI